MESTISRRLDFSDVALYGVTSTFKNNETLLKQIDAMLAGGVDAVQLRANHLTDRDFVALGKSVKAKCEKAGALFIVNNRVDLALVINADGVHVGHTDLPVATVRQLVGHRKLIGASTHSLPQALEAQRAGVDYVSCGPVWATPTKPEYAAVGTNLIGLYKAALRIPFVVIGGVDETTIDQAVAAGARCVAAVRVLFEAADAQAVAANLKAKVQANRQRA